MKSSLPPSAPGSYVARVLSIALDSAILVASLEVAVLLVRIPGARAPSSAALLSLAAFGAGALATLPAAALAALRFRHGLARRLGALWWLLAVIAAGVIAYSQRVILLGLARDYGWMRAAGVVGLLCVALGLPASFLVRDAALQQRRALVHGLVAMLATLIASGVLLGLEVFVRMQPPLHAFLGLAGATCVVLLRALLHDGRRPVWLAGVALAGAMAAMLPAITAHHVVHAHAAHRGLLLADVLHLVHPDATPLQAVPATRVATEASRPLGTQPRLVLLVTIDSLRFDVAQSPSLTTLSALRARAIELTAARTTAGFTIAAMYSLMTGRGPWQITWQPMHFMAGNVPKVVPVPMMDDTPTLARSLAQRGYRTAACGVMLAQTPGWGLSNGFERLDLSIYEARNRDARGTTADLVQACALRMLDESDGAPLFLWLHYYDPHGPYSVHAGIDVDESDPFDRYRGEARFVDRHLGALLRELERRVSWDDVLLVIASDHGEEFGEHGGAAHVYALYEETLRVPLLIAAPGLGPRRIEAPVSLADVAPTLIELLGAAPLTDTIGVSLAGAMRGEPLPPRPMFAQTVRLSRSQRAIVDGNYKLIHDSRLGTHELFDLARDPGEQWSLVDALPDLAAALSRAMGVPPPR
ncbi:MAG TPA: sulfatase-like hydrolase/transferase [Haliangium sp.]|nr:sulfatase-like hydrolase/transferase [Haliangium sp.]